MSETTKDNIDKHLLSKIIGISQFKSVTIDGDLAKYYVVTYNDGIIVVRKFVLSSKENVLDFKVITKRFGKTLYCQDVAYKYGSLYTIHQIVSKALIENKIPRENIII